MLHKESLSKISVLFASDIPILPGSVMNLVDNTDNVKVVACAQTQKAVLPLADVHRPQLAVLDLDVAWDAIHHLARGLLRRQIQILLIRTSQKILMCTSLVMRILILPFILIIRLIIFWNK